MYGKSLALLITLRARHVLGFAGRIVFDVIDVVPDLTLCCHLVREDRRSQTHNAVSKYIQ